MEYYIERITQAKKKKHHGYAKSQPGSLFCSLWSSRIKRRREREKKRAKEATTPTPLSKATANTAISTNRKTSGTTDLNDFYL